MKLTIKALLFVIGFCFTPFAVQAEPATEAELKTLIVQLVTDYGVSEEDASAYLLLVAKVANARETAEQDGTELSALRAEMLEKYSQAFLLGSSVVAKGEKLYDEKIASGTPGAKVPPEVVAEIRIWAAQAGQVLTIGAGASKLATEYATRAFIESRECQTATFNINDCLDRLEKTVGMIHEVVEHLDLMVEATSVLYLAVVSRMTY